MEDATVRNSRRQSTYQQLLNAIREGIYSPGDRLREEEVAQRLGVSRTPVREALGRLHEKGLVEAAPGRGLAIAVLSLQQIFELYAVRKELEALVARFACQHATEAEIVNLRRLNGMFAQAETAREAARLNRLFHTGLYDAARNHYLRAAVEDLQETVALLPATTFLHEGRTTVAAEEHEAMIAAIAARDAKAAAEAAAMHIARSLDTRLELMGKAEA